MNTEQEPRESGDLSQEKIGARGSETKKGLEWSLEKVGNAGQARGGGPN